MGIKVKKVLLKIGIILVAIVTLGLVTRAVFNYTTGKKLESIVEKMKFEGKPLTTKEFEPKGEDQDNGAILWRGAAAMFSVEKSEREMLSQTMENIFYNKPLEENTKKRLRRIIEENQKVLELIREAAEKPYFKYAENWDGPSEEIEVPNLVKMITVVRLLAVDAVLKAEDAQIDEAVERCLIGVRFSKHLLDEPFLIHYLVAVANMKQLVFCLNRITDEEKIGEDTLLNILKELDIEPWRRGLVRSFEKEKISSFETGISIIKGDLTVVEAGFWDKVYYWLCRPIVKTEITWLLKLYEEMERAADLPYYQTDETREIFEKKYGNPPWYFRITGFLFPNLVTAMFKEATLEAMLLTAQTGISCKIYKNQHGEYPEKLAKLVPDILEKGPVDPFTGKAFVYRRLDNGFIVYSLGSNEKDDEGRGTLKITSIVMEKDDDWAWKEGVD